MCFDESSASATDQATSTVTFVSNSGDGRPQTVEIEGPMTVAQFLLKVLGTDNGGGAFKVRVNQAPAPNDTQLTGGETVVATPAKIQGAR